VGLRARRHAGARAPGKRGLSASRHARTLCRSWKTIAAGAAKFGTAPRTLFFVFLVGFLIVSTGCRPLCRLPGSDARMPWALVELDANHRDGAPPLQLQFLGRQRFAKSRRPFIKPAGFTPRRSEPPPEAQRPTAAAAPAGDALQRAANPPRLALPEAVAHAPGGAEGADAPPSHRGRVLPVRPAQRQPSPRVALPRGAGGPPVPGLVLAVAEDGCGAGPLRSARRGAAFTPRSQALEDAKAAQRRNMANGYMKKLMCAPPPSLVWRGLFAGLRLLHPHRRRLHGGLGVLQRVTVRVPSRAGTRIGRHAEPQLRAW